MTDLRKGIRMCPLPRRQVLLNNEPITSEAQGVTGYYLETENADQRGPKVSRDLRVESTDRKSLQTWLSSSKRLGKKSFHDHRTKSGECANFLIRREWILDQNGYLSGFESMHI